MYLYNLTEAKNQFKKPKNTYGASTKTAKLGVHITTLLCKYDHVSVHWLPVESQIQYHSLCAIYGQYM